MGLSAVFNRRLQDEDADAAITMDEAETTAPAEPQAEDAPKWSVAVPKLTAPWPLQMSCVTMVGPVRFEYLHAPTGRFDGFTASAVRVPDQPETMHTACAGLTLLGLLAVAWSQFQRSSSKTSRR